MSSRKDIVGQKYGRWTILEYVPGTHKIRPATVRARCDCGTVSQPQWFHVRTGGSVSCGCYASELTTVRSTKHGKHDTREYNSWMAMKARCYTHGYHHFHRYGGRGITVCQRWLDSFENFLSDVGPCPGQGYSLDRINNDGNYEPSNVRWADRKTQVANRQIVKDRLITIGSQTKSVAEWAAEVGIWPENFLMRIKRGWTQDELLLPRQAVGRPRKKVAQ